MCQAGSDPAPGTPCTPCTPDVNCSGNVDLGDHVFFVDCLSSPDAAPNPTMVTGGECLTIFDFDHDADVALGDAAEFLPLITGG